MEAKEYNEQVQVQARRSHGKVERLGRYLDKTNNGAGDLDGEGRGQEVQGHDTVVGKNKAGGAGRQGMYKDKGTRCHDQDQDSGNTDSEGEDGKKRAASDTIGESDIDGQDRGRGAAGYV